MTRIVSLLVIVLLGNCFANENETASGFGYELLLAKMDYLEFKFLELKVCVKEQSESLHQSQDQSKADLLEQLRLILEQQRMFADHQKMIDSIFELHPRKHPSDNSKLISLVAELASVSESPYRTNTISSCRNESTKKSGPYQINVSNSTYFEVYCEQSLYDGGWIVIQNRFNGSVDFYRNWTEYQNGFGSLDGEFWIGLDKIHLLTSSKSFELMIHLEDFKGKVKYARYKEFQLGGSNELYALKKLGEYNGTAGDSLTRHKNKKFSTFDKDNDSDGTENCAISRHGAWWYENCADGNLMGKYENKDDYNTMNWFYFNSDYGGLKVSKMMLREL